MAFAQRIRSAKELGVRMAPIGMVRERMDDLVTFYLARSKRGLNNG
jgi:hypothetical protein